MWNIIARLVCLLVIAASSSVVTYLIFKYKAEVAKQKLLKLLVEFKEVNQQLRQLLAIMDQLVEILERMLGKKDQLLELLKKHNESLSRSLDELAALLLRMRKKTPSKTGSN